MEYFSNLIKHTHVEAKIALSTLELLTTIENGVGEFNKS